MSAQIESEGLVAPNAQAALLVAGIENIAEDLRRSLNSIQAIAYYVEMTLPLSEMSSLEYLRKVQNLVDECNQRLQPFTRMCRGSEETAGKTIEPKAGDYPSGEPKAVSAAAGFGEARGTGTCA